MSKPTREELRVARTVAAKLENYPFMLCPLCGGRDVYDVDSLFLAQAQAQAQAQCRCQECGHRWWGDW